MMRNVFCFFTCFFSSLTLFLHNRPRYIRGTRHLILKLEESDLVCSFFHAVLNTVRQLRYHDIDNLVTQLVPSFQSHRVLALEMTTSSNIQFCFDVNSSLLIRSSRYLSACEPGTQAKRETKQKKHIIRCRHTTDLVILDRT